MNLKQFTPLVILCGVMMGLLGCNDHASTPGLVKTNTVTEALEASDPTPTACSLEVCVALGMECGAVSLGDVEFPCGSCGDDATCESGVCVAKPCEPTGDIVRTCTENTVIGTDSCGMSSVIAECSYRCESGACMEKPCEANGDVTRFCMADTVVGTDSCGVSSVIAECSYGCQSGVCIIPVCQDGKPQGNEVCDDGNAVDDDECTNACALPDCGDGITQSRNNEECDDANDVDDDACSNGCVLAKCGDGVLQTMEVCDDGNANDGDRCDATCQKTFRYAFVTSEMHTGNLGGLEGADAICQRLAEKAGLPGTYLAWLSDWLPQPIGYRSPVRRFAMSEAGYITVTGAKIADNTADLFDFSLDAPLNVTELGGPAPVNPAIRCPFDTPVRTGAFGDGRHIPFLYSQTCGEWTKTTGINGNTSPFGNASTASQYWAYGCLPSGGCALEAPHYCLEQ